MAAANIVKFFVTDEPGTSSLLATVFDPGFMHEGQGSFRKKFAERLAAQDVILPVEGKPAVVQPEYLNVDLVLVWGQWILLIENKVSRAAITRRQLARYYKAALKTISRGVFLNSDTYRDHDICVVYVTPTESTGAAEFASLQLAEDRKDKKVHLPWTAMLDDLEASFPPHDEDDSYARLIRDGCQLTKEILQKHSAKTITADTPERIATKAFLDRMQKKVADMMGLETALKLMRWKDPRMDELYGQLGGNNANVYLNIFDQGTDLTNQDDAVLSGSVSFQIARKARRKYRDRFASFPHHYWSEMIGLAAESLRINDHEVMVLLENTWSGTCEELERELAGLFCRFLMVCRPFMVDPQAPDAPEN